MRMQDQYNKITSMYGLPDTVKCNAIISNNNNNIRFVKMVSANTQKISSA